MIEPPQHVIRYKSRNKWFTYFRKDGKRTRLPDMAEEPAKFWRAYERLTQSDYSKTIEHMIDAYMGSADFGRMSEATQRDYIRYLLQFRRDMITAKVDGVRSFISPDDVKPSHLLYLRDRHAKTPVAANHMLSVIKSLYKWAVPRDLARGNPAATVPQFRIQTEGRLAWPDWAFKLSQAKMRPDLAVAVALGYYTGQRLNDVLSMQLNDLVKAKGRSGREVDCVKLRQHKTGKALEVPIHPGLAPTIKQLRLRGWFPLVAKPDRQQYTAQQFQAAWGREMKKPATAAIREAGLSFHGLRKSAASNLAQVGCSTDMIMAITGLSRNMVSTYTRGVDQLDLAIDAMELWKVKG